MSGLASTFQFSEIVSKGDGGKEFPFPQQQQMYRELQTGVRNMQLESESNVVIVYGQENIRYNIPKGKVSCEELSKRRHPTTEQKCILTHCFTGRFITESFLLTP
jgi:hypothetical protein